MPRGRKPGTPKTGGKVKGSRHKVSIGRAHREVEQANPDLDPFERQRFIARFFEGQAAVEQDKSKNGEKFDRKLMNDCLDRAARIWRSLGEYERPRLASIKVDGTMKHDLTRLSDAELLALRRIVGKTAVE